MYGIAGLLTGRTLAGRYLIEAVIGRGGMGAVYRATDERLSRLVAVKVVGAVTTDPDEHARLRQRFQREARAAAALRHPNVVQVHDFGTDPELDLDFLVMELLHGEDLAARLMRGGPPPLAESISILRQAARGLSAGHRAGMVHRDVKPGNLFLEEDDAHGGDHVRVLDFGIAQVGAEDGTMTQLTVYGRSPFSPAYASPEQLRGDDHITSASDVFSLGAVGYHLVTGTRPFTSADPSRATAEVGEAVRLLRQRAPALDDATYAVLVRALARTPVERFRDAGEMADALSGGVPASARARTVAPPAAAPAPQPTYARSTPSAPLRPVPDDEQTRIYAAAPPQQPAMRPQPQQVPVQAVYPTPRPAVPQANPAGLFAPAGQPPEYATQPRPGPVRRFLRALSELVLTTAAVGLFVASWALAIQGVVEDRHRRLIAGAVATVLFTPLAVHRLTGSRGRLPFLVAGSVFATGLAWWLVGRGGDPAIKLAAIFGLQVLASFFMSWLTRRKPAPEYQPYSEG
ncbi:serine/threonine-protein kinase [Longimicrobium sp.]|uniref:serine/threonine-protein kinase n=1 Tax=Longimicrobium sp. TaxID=2029185 RepID=UPI002C25ADEE|nr:protein kinase [Longimicrobium sp.]HSU15072.1 protein kinase [Longimicrobium sp.]